MIFVDSNILIDILIGESAWTAWSLRSLAAARADGQLGINHVVVAEVASLVQSEDEVDQMIAELGISLLPLTLAAALRSGQAFKSYRHRGGERTSILADFLIAGHASVVGAPLITRDKRKIGGYFPELTLITPETDHG